MDHLQFLASLSSEQRGSEQRASLKQKSDSKFSTRQKGARGQDNADSLRTTFTNAVVRRLAWNMPYHAEHHAFPAVPIHKLPELHQLLKQHLQCTEQGYGRFHRQYVANPRGTRNAVTR